MGEGIIIIEGLNKDGLLDPMPENRPANPVTGNKLTITGQQTYTNTSGIEAEFFGMFKYALIHSWKGAYHMNPDYSHWYGWAQINLDLEKIKSQNRTLRRIAELENAQKTTEKGTKATPGFGTELAVLGIMVSLLLVMKRRS